MSSAPKQDHGSSLRISSSFFFFFNFYLFMIVTQREREAETQAEGEAGSMQPGARRGIRSWVSRIVPWAKGRR